MFNRGAISLDLRYTEIRDLSLLKGLWLRELTIENTPVSDLSPLKGRNIDGLWLRRTKVTDITPIANLPMSILDLPSSNLKGIDKLTNIYGRVWISDDPFYVCDPSIYFSNDRALIEDGYRSCESLYTCIINRSIIGRQVRELFKDETIDTIVITDCFTHKPTGSMVDYILSLTSCTNRFDSGRLPNISPRVLLQTIVTLKSGKVLRVDIGDEMGTIHTPKGHANFIINKTTATPQKNRPSYTLIDFHKPTPFPYEWKNHPVKDIFGDKKIKRLIIIRNYYKLLPSQIETIVSKMFCSKIILHPETNSTKKHLDKIVAIVLFTDGTGCFLSMDSDLVRISTPAGSAELAKGRKARSH
jgi:hypothetical protein